MTHTIASVRLPVNEVLRIRKNRLLPSGTEKTLRRISVVTGIHGDELEGQYVCWELQRRIAAHPEYLTGIVDIYPAMNPLGIDMITRGLPAFDLDMNRIFPGGEHGHMYEYLANEIIKDVMGSDLVIDIHASNIYLTEMPQIRINVQHEKNLLPYAAPMNVDFIWVHENSTVLASTFAYSLNSRGTPTLVVEMGVGMRITKALGDQLVTGILETMRRLGIWSGPAASVKKPLICNNPSLISYLNAPASGIYIKELEIGSHVKKGDLIGKLVNPLTGEVVSECKAPQNGLLFTTREYPVVAEGSLLGRILKQ